ncbi:hypothetical protein I4U23_017806 [Adineta vaga]|nr:hypothetical protein I4U23_017806 [Adineta vaga]
MNRDDNDNCSGRWQIIDKLNIKITLDWQIFPKTNKFITEFRTNLVDEGFWYGFGLSSSSSNEIESLVYALRRKENDSEIFWDIYNITESEVIVSEQNSSSIVMFQPLSSSGLLTIQPVLNEQRCSHFVYMRGRFSGDIPLLPDEIRFNQSLCLTFDSTFHMLIGCIVGVGFLMTLIITILCLYGYYKCRRQQFRHLTEQQTIKFKTDIDSYTWLGQQPSISCSSPYLIQSTSI